MKPISGTAQVEASTGFANELIVPAATPGSEGRAHLSMRYVAVGAAPPPSPPPRPVLISRCEPRFEIKPGPDLELLIERKFGDPAYRLCHARSAPPPPPLTPSVPEPPEAARKDPRWPPGDMNREIEREPDADLAPDDPLADVRPDKRGLLSADPAPKKPGDLLPRQAQVIPPIDGFEPWLPVMPSIPQPHTLPPLMKEFFSRTPEPPLMRALQMLLSQGLDPMAKDEMGNTMLMLAVATGKPLLARYLIGQMPGLLGHLLNRFGENAATLAQAYCPEVLPLLLESGVEQRPRNPVLQWYLVQPVVVTDSPSRLQELATLLAQDNCLNLRDEDGRTLLFHAVIRGDVDVVRFLCNLSVGPAVVWRDATGKSLFGYTTAIADVRLGSLICKELKALRRRDRPLYRRAVDRF